MTTTSKGRQAAPVPPRFLTQADLRDRGIRYHYSHLRRLWLQGDFPKPINLSPRRIVWDENEINHWLKLKAEAAA